MRGRVDGEGEAHAFALGAALTHGDAAWILIEHASADGRGLGAALVWARRRGARTIDVIAGSGAGAGVMARRAALFAPPVTVWQADGAELRRAVAQPVGRAAPADPRHLALVPVIEAAGARPVVEHGVVTGEVRGLEVCRVVTTEGDDHGAGVRLEVGVGVHDREAFALIHGDVPAGEALAAVVATVEAHRGAAGPGHPLDRLVPERYLRWRLERCPQSLGLAELHAVEGPVARPGVKEPSPCTALARTVRGEPVVVVFSVGVDLDLVPYAADARLAWDSEAAMVVTLRRDLVVATAELSSALRQPVTLVAAPETAEAADDSVSADGASSV